MWIVTLFEKLDPNDYGTMASVCWTPSWRNAEDFISENRKGLRMNPVFNYACIEHYRCNYPTKLIEHVFPHFTTFHHVFRFDNEKNTFVRDKRLDCKIPKDHWLAFRRNYGDGRVEYREEYLKK